MARGRRTQTREAGVFVQGATNVMDGNIITVLDFEGNFAWVRKSDGAEGFLKREYLYELEEHPTWIAPWKRAHLMKA